MSNKYIHLFESNEAYETERASSYREPWTSYTIENDEVNYNKNKHEKMRERMLSTPLTFEAAVNSVTVQLYMYNSNTQANTVAISTDNGTTWTNKTSTLNGVILATLNKGEKVQVKIVSGYFGYNNDDNWVRGNRFKVNNDCYIYGNIMSLEYPNDFATQTTVAYSLNYHNLFYGQTHILFKEDEDLVLPATTLKSECYFNMFYGCTGITKSPELPATTLVYGCYRGMFQNCTNLKSIKCLATNISASTCLTDWVNNVSSTGDFIGDDTMQPIYGSATNTWSFGINGVPSGWSYNGTFIAT